MLIALIVLLVMLSASITLNAVFFWRMVVLADELLKLEGHNRARLPTEDRLQEP